MFRRGHFYYWKRVLIALLYVLLYEVLSWTMFPPTSYVLLRQEASLGDQYGLVHLASGRPALTDRQGAEVFTSRNCGRCFITNNRGFAPMWEYDALVLHDGEEPRGFPADKRFTLHATDACLRGNLVNCDVEPTLTSEETKESLDLCGLCDLLLKRRDENRFS